MPLDRETDAGLTELAEAHGKSREEVALHAIRMAVEISWWMSLSRGGPSPPQFTSQFQSASEPGPTFPPRNPTSRASSSGHSQVDPSRRARWKRQLAEVNWVQVIITVLGLVGLVSGAVYVITRMP